MEASSAALKLRWFGNIQSLALGRQLKNFTTLAEVLPPQTFQGSLRHYQQEGLNWIQFLREYKLAGILADDMGLGKTVQVLAHLAVEKSAGRVKAPFLVVAPTSTMENWKNEAERFIPGIRLLDLFRNSSKGTPNYRCLQ